MASGSDYCGAIKKEGTKLPVPANAVKDVTATVAAKAAAQMKKSNSGLLGLVLNSLKSDKALDIVPIDLAGKSEMADHMVIASGRSSRQVVSMAEKLADRVKQDLGRPCRMEGKDQGDWVLIDCGDIVVHIFRPEVREFYQLEKMWMDGTQRAAKA